MSNHHAGRTKIAALRHKSFSEAAAANGPLSTPSEAARSLNRTRRSVRRKAWKFSLPSPPRSHLWRNCVSDVVYTDYIHHAPSSHLGKSPPNGADGCLFLFDNRVRRHTGWVTRSTSNKWLHHHNIGSTQGREDFPNYQPQASPATALPPDENSDPPFSSRLPGVVRGVGWWRWRWVWIEGGIRIPNAQPMGILTLKAWTAMVGHSNCNDILANTCTLAYRLSPIQ